MKRRAAILGMGLALAAGTGFAEVSATSPLDSPKFCAALDDFGAAPPHAQQVTFFWPEPTEDQIDMYAAMSGYPMDARAHRLYRAYGQATHYLPLTDLKTRLERCASAKAGRVLLDASQAACDGAPSSQACLRITRSERR